MTFKVPKSFSVSLTIGAVMGVSNITLARSISLVFDHPIMIAEPTREGLANKREFEKGKAVEIDAAKAHWIQSKGKIPIILVPLSGDVDESVKIPMTDVAEWPPETVERELDQKLGTMMDLMTQFQISIGKKDIKEAEKVLDQMMGIKNTVALNFLRAYLAFIKGDLENARDYVKRGLERYPAHVQGTELLNVLDGGKRMPANVGSLPVKNATTNAAASATASTAKNAPKSSSKSPRKSNRKSGGKKR